jgi:hypothetical protein
MVRCFYVLLPSAQSPPIYLVTYGIQLGTLLLSLIGRISPAKEGMVRELEETIGHEFKSGKREQGNVFFCDLACAAYFVKLTPSRPQNKLTCCSYSNDSAATAEALSTGRGPLPVLFPVPYALSK